MVITSTLETLPTHIVASPLASLNLFPSFCFELPILAIEPVSNTHVLLGVLVRYTYIKYTFVEVASLLIYQVFEAVPLPMTVPLIEALRLGFGFLGFFTGAATGLPFMKFPLLALALL